VDASLRSELLALRAADEQRREELVREGTLFDGYHPRMEEVHRANAARLRELVARHGWPARELAGEDGAEAAWIVVQHAIGEPEFQREMLVVLKAAAQRGEIPAYHPAYLEDRICMFEGRPQIYGTQFMTDDEGLPALWTVDDPEHVNERRAVIGLDTIEERTAKMRGAVRPDERPKNMEAYRRGYEEWLKKTGWRK
jgi:hypothetical protein